MATPAMVTEGEPLLPLPALLLGALPFGETPGELKKDEEVAEAPVMAGTCCR